jgi:hypothetical protein
MNLWEWSQRAGVRCMRPKTSVGGGEGSCVFGFVSSPDGVTQIRPRTPCTDTDTGGEQVSGALHAVAGYP